MPGDGRIIDIRYERDPSPPSARLFALLDASRWVGDRVGSKLRELGLRLGDVDQLVVVLRAGTPCGELVVEPPTASRGHAVCTLDPDGIALLSAPQRDARLADVTFAALARLCGDDRDAVAILDAGRVALDTHGRRLPVVVLESEAAGRFTRVLHFLTPVRPGPLRMVRPGNAYTAILEVVDGATGEHRCTRLFDFDSYDELNARVASIEWKCDRVTIRSRRGSAHRDDLDLALADLVPLGDRGHLAALSLEPS